MVNEGSIRNVDVLIKNERIEKIAARITRIDTNYLFNGIT